MRSQGEEGEYEALSLSLSLCLSLAPGCTRGFEKKRRRKRQKWDVKEKDQYRARAERLLLFVVAGVIHLLVSFFI